LLFPWPLCRESSWASLDAAIWFFRPKGVLCAFLDGKGAASFRRFLTFLTQMQTPTSSNSSPTTDGTMISTTLDVFELVSAEEVLRAVRFRENNNSSVNIVKESIWPACRSRPIVKQEKCIQDCDVLPIVNRSSYRSSDSEHLMLPFLLSGRSVASEC